MKTAFVQARFNGARFAEHTLPVGAPASLEIAARLDELRSMENGWHDGQGLAPNRARIDQIAPSVIGHYPEKLPLPVIIPTPEGDLLFEWEAAGEPSLDIRLSDLGAQFHAFIPGGADVESEFDLSAPDTWPRLFAFLLQHIQPRFTPE